MNKSYKRALIWDWDGTVVSSYGVIRHSLAATLDHFNVEGAKKSQAMEKAGIVSLRDFFPETFGLSRWEAARDYFYKAFADSHIQKLDIILGADKVIEEIHNEYSDIYLAVVSNKRGDLLREEAAALNLTRFFGRIVGATDAKRDKPDPACLLMALEGSGVAPGDNVCVIGDSSTDLEMAYNSGSRAIFFGSSKYPAQFGGTVIGSISEHSHLKDVINEKWLKAAA